MEGTAHSKATKDNGCVINSSRFPLDFADVSDEDNKIKAEIVHPPISQENIREESTAQEKPDEEMALNPPASAHSENQKQTRLLCRFRKLWKMQGERRLRLQRRTAPKQPHFLSRRHKKMLPNLKLAKPRSL